MNGELRVVSFLILSSTCGAFWLLSQMFGETTIQSSASKSEGHVKMVPTGRDREEAVYLISVVVPF